MGAFRKTNGYAGASSSQTEGKVRAHIKAYPDASLKEIAAVFEVWPSAVEKACKRYKITWKKTLTYEKADAEKRAAFQETLATIPRHKIVYLEEYGVLDRLCPRRTS